MSGRGAEKPLADAPQRPSESSRASGARAFERRAQHARRQAARKQATRRRRVRAPSYDPRRVLARIPRAALLCAAIACLNGICWSIVTPPFQAPDETSDFAYTQELAQTERLPAPGPSKYSPQETAILSDLHHQQVRFHPGVTTISSSAEQRQLQRDLDAGLSRRGTGRVGVAASQPPLYYALELVPYGLGLAGTMLDQLELMRLLSAVLGGLTAMFAYLFVREALPAARWAWAVGGLGVALAPSLGMMSGAVNPDALLFTVSAAILYCLARAFRLGLTRPWALAIGGLLAVGFLTKLNFIGLAPGVLAGLAVLTVRARRELGNAALRSLALALAVAASPLCLYILVNVLSGDPALGIVSHALHIASSRGGSIVAAFSYVWQFYLPRLPGMSPYFHGVPMSAVWFDRSVGLYGWLDTSFPAWVEKLALAPAALLALLALRAVLVDRAALRRRLGELGVYVAMGLGLLALVGADSWLTRGSEGGGYLEPRYLLPLLPLLAAVLALAARGAGRRWGPSAGGAIVALFLAHDLFSQLLVISRFYG